MDVFATWLEESELTADSRQAYQTELKRLQRYLVQRRVDMGDVDAALLRRFWAGVKRGRWHETTKAPAASSLQQSRRIIGAFVRWAVQHEWVTPSSLGALREWRVEAAPSVRVTEVPKLSAGQMRCLLEVEDWDAAAAALSFWVGATPLELSALRLNEIDLREGRITLAGRGPGTTVALPKALSRALTKLPADVEPYVFGGSTPASAAAVSQRIRRWLHVNPIGQLSCARELRGYFHVHATSAGWSGDEIRAQLRRPSLRLSASPPPAVRRLESLVRAV